MCTPCLRLVFFKEKKVIFPYNISSFVLNHSFPYNHKNCLERDIYWFPLNPFAELFWHHLVQLPCYLLLFCLTSSFLVYSFFCNDRSSRKKEQMNLEMLTWIRLCVFPVLCCNLIFGMQVILFCLLSSIFQLGSVIETSISLIYLNLFPYKSTISMWFGRSLVRFLFIGLKAL